MKKSSHPIVYGHRLRQSRLCVALQIGLLASSASLLHIPAAIADQLYSNFSGTKGGAGDDKAGTSTGSFTPHTAGTKVRLAVLAAADDPPYQYRDYTPAAGTNGAEGKAAPAVTAGPTVSPYYNEGWVLRGDNLRPALTFITTGAAGGNGGDAGEAPVFGFSNGGDAAAGGNGGTLTLTLEAGTDLSTLGTTATALVVSNGGRGGKGGNPGNIGHSGHSGQGGQGGTGGTIFMKANGSITNAAPYTGTTLAPAAVVITSLGGAGASGDVYAAQTKSDKPEAIAGGAGGAGGFVTFSATDDSTPPTITSNGAGVIAISAGGEGSFGATAGTDFSTKTARGGDGGAGGAGGTVVINSGNATVVARGVSAAGTGERYNIPQSSGSPKAEAVLSATSGAIIAQSLGGDGGRGGIANGSFDPATAGAGGAAGVGGNVVVYTAGPISATGYGGAGIVAQSVGGSGGNGATAGSIFKAKGGSGGFGGDGGLVTVEADDYASTASGSALISTKGDESSAILAQSIGGGGGNGGSVAVNGSLTTLFSVALGGNGEKGGQGSLVDVRLGAADANFNVVTTGAVVSTQGVRSTGVLAQSIGGGGGVGGMAVANTVGGVLSVAIGGIGGVGGAAGQSSDSFQQVRVENWGGSVRTDGDHSPGVVAQAIGGGGGNGGAAHALTVGAQITNAVSVGGNGGTGGTAGNVTVHNAGQVMTEQADSYGVLAQSIGGGGGNGGASFAETLNAFNAKDFPSVNMTTAVGGQGVSGGDAGLVTIRNEGVVITRGAGSIGLFAQTVGGGGGSGGSSAALQVATISSNADVSVAVGGTGGAGGAGGGVSLINDSGVVMTYSTGAIGVFGQSIGGGGGYGGSVKLDSASFLGGSKGVNTTVALGGSGGSGNVGGDVTISNINGASVSTLGDGAFGIGAQSVGGGGGIGGASTDGGSGGNIVVNVSLGGNGGSGNHGGRIFVQNAGTILTFGGKADSVFAQSVGGAGGSTVDKSTSSGGTDPEVRAADYLVGGMGVGAGLIDRGNGLYDLIKDELIGDGAIDKMVESFTNYVKNNPVKEAGADQASNWTVSVDVGATKGGRGGSGGDGNQVVVDNAGTLETHGPNAAGIFAQSVGGSGGSASAAKAENNPQGLINTNIPVSGTLALGGGGGSSGQGGAVTVTNEGRITTYGVASNAITAQSVGGGGGTGGVTMGNPQRIQAFNVSLGGKDGANGGGGAVMVTADASSALLATSGASSSGIVAQSIGGGGGTATLMTSVDSTLGDTYQSSIDWSSAAAVTLGATTGTSGQGGLVTVTAGNIQTTGMDAHAVVAQSVGGGGGVVVGGVAADSAASTLFHDGAISGTAGDVVVNLSAGRSLVTEGDGAFGIIAQSVGGGGLLATRTTSGTAGTADFQKNNGRRSGNGGHVDVTVAEGASIATSGRGSHGVFAQSVGGGGGLAINDAGLVMGTVGGQGVSSPINVTVNGSVQSTGAHSAAVFINADGQQGSSNAAVLSVGAKGVLSSAGDWGTVLFRSPANTAAVNKVANNGQILASQDGGVAIYSWGGAALDVDNYGFINGRVDLGQGKFQNLGSQSAWNAGAYNRATQFINNVEIDVFAPATFDGDLVNNDALVAQNVDFVQGTGGQFNVTGKATMANDAHFLVVPSMLSRNTFTLLTASAIDYEVIPTVSARGANAGQFIYNLTPYNDRITVLPIPNMGATAQKLSASTAATNLARHLDAGFSSSVSGEMAQHYATLANIQTGDGLVRALDGLGNEGVQSVGTSHMTRSHSFVERMNSCPQFGDNGTELTERPCTWVRVMGNEAKRSASASSNGYKSEDYTLQIGGQVRLANDWFVGGSISSDHTTALDSSGNASVKGRGVTVGAVLKRQFGNWLVSGAVDAGITEYDSKRRIRMASVDRTADGSFDGQHFGIHARLARQIPLATWYLKPYLDLHATRLSTNSYEERGAGALNLRVAKASDTMLAASPMLEIGHRLNFANGLKLHTYASAGLTATNDSNWGADTQLVGAVAEAGSFRSVSSAPGTRVKLNVGVNLVTRANFDLKLEYSGEFASGYRAHIGSLKVSYLY